MIRAIKKLLFHIRWIVFGSITYTNQNGQSVVIKKEVRYCIKDGTSCVHVEDTVDLLEYCKMRKYIPCNSTHL